MTDLETSAIEQAAAEDNETNELIRNAYRVIDSVYRDLDIRSFFRGSRDGSSVGAQTPSEPLQAQRRDLDTVSVDGSNESISTSLNSNSTCDDVINTTDSTSYRDLDTISVDEHRNSALNSTYDDVINTSDSPSHRSSTFEMYTPREDAEDDVIIVSSNLTDFVDLCTPVHEIPRRRRRRTPIYRQNENLVNFRSRPNSQLRSSENSPFSPNLHTKTPTSSNIAAEQPVASISAGETTNERSVLICPVCMESSVKRKPTSTKCGHVFCETCIKKAVSHTKKCPMCNTRLTDRMLFRIYL